MKITKRVFLSCLIFCSLWQLNAFSQTTFEKPFLIKVDGKILNNGGIGYAAPFIGDIDGDGINELLVGYWKDRNGGPLVIYENTGTKKQPVYKKSRLLKINNETAMVPGG